MRSSVPTTPRTVPHGPAATPSTRRHARDYSRTRETPSTRRDQQTMAKCNSSSQNEKVIIAPRRRVASAARSRDFCLCFVLEGENGGQVEVRGVPGQSRSSAVHSPSSRAYQSARQGEFSFVVSGPATACWSGVVFFVFFCGRSRSTRRGFVLWALQEHRLFRRQVLLGKRPERRRRARLR